ncbi:hypothetical protein BWQ96_03845 [Gracilariopsis chorda]|uniref:Uncharacterized protein n=1 Tax=Gracilariopsis chorda TaxID=448386 RepID=A0A2V3IW21_9FLOR|nr:hypothetical protein BWQ96_03845 [Gracilariopsis chorda]|eukprot:PXF46346.1 hypothetical protein BWQ96_03845 [Gracilariopsis chorda]
MEIEAFLDAVFFHPFPNPRLKTPGPTLKPRTPDKHGDPVSWRCYPPILGHTNPRKGLPGLCDQISLLCPSTAYVLLPSDSISDMKGEDLDLIVDVSEALRYVHEDLGVDMYVVLVFREVATEVCQSYAHVFQADIALTGCVGNLIYESILFDMKPTSLDIIGGEDHRHLSLASCTGRTPLPISRCRILPFQRAGSLYSFESPLRVVWRGSIFSQNDSEYSGFRFLHTSTLGMPIGRVTMKSCYPSSLSASISTSDQAAFLVTLDITASATAIDLVESWRECNAHVILDFDGATFVASWAPPREQLNYWHIMVVSAETVSTQVENAHVSKTRPCCRISDKQSILPSILPPDVMALPVFSFKDMISASVNGHRSLVNCLGDELERRCDSSQARNLTRALSLKRDMKSKMDPNCRTVRRRREGFDSESLDHMKGPSKRAKNVNYIHLSPTVSKNSRYRQFPSAYTIQDSRCLANHFSGAGEAGQRKVKSRLGRQVSVKIDYRLVVIAMRQAFESSPLSCAVRRGTTKDKVDLRPRSWSRMGLMASDYDGPDTGRQESLSDEENTFMLHGIEYQCRDATAEVEAAIHTAGAEFIRSSISSVKLSRVMHALEELKRPLPSSGEGVSVF